ncbi:hypothetical protein EZS27_031687 [termite gut metagenome]|uniref:Uncharacterized protein n=1 Tax=termite gut metagenome TaxID=433724 RepID=A0A5J4Q938_9ZZZZ
MNSEKIDTSAVYTLFEELKESLKQRNEKPIEPAQVDMTAINAMTERFKDLIEEVRKPTKVNHHHVISIGSNKVFFSLVGMCIVILILSFTIYNQRETISQYKENDLKYRYIKMQGQATKNNIYRLERLFEYRDSVGIICKQVEKYEQLVKEQAERIERGKQNEKETDRLTKEIESLKKEQIGRKPRTIPIQKSGCCFSEKILGLSKILCKWLTTRLLYPISLYRFNLCPKIIKN